jgi:hypothetical protein
MLMMERPVWQASALMNDVLPVPAAQQERRMTHHMLPGGNNATGQLTGARPVWPPPGEPSVEQHPAGARSAHTDSST